MDLVKLFVFGCCSYFTTFTMVLVTNLLVLWFLHLILGSMGTRAMPVVSCDVCVVAAIRAGRDQMFHKYMLVKD